MDRAGRDPYDKYQWTLPVEFECSMMLFMCQLCFHRLRPHARLIFMFCLATYCMKYLYWQYFLFLIGMIVCDLQFEFNSTGAGKAGSSTNAVASTYTPGTPLGAVVALVSRICRSMAGYQTAIGMTVFIACLYVMSTPEAIRGAVGTPGYITMIQMVPQHHQKNGKIDYFWVPIGASLAVLTVDRTPVLQRLFTNRFAQYMGTISYSLTQLHYGFGLALCAVPLWATLIFCADLATRTLDKWSLSMGRKLYDYLAVRDPKPQAVLPRTN